MADKPKMPLITLLEAARDLLKLAHVRQLQHTQQKALLIQKAVIQNAKLKNSTKKD